MGCNQSPCTGGCNDCNKSASDNLTYVGPNLPCTNIETNDNMTIVVQKIDEALCVAGLTTSTTTSSTSTSTTTSTTTQAPFKSYVALLTQTGTTAPVPTVIFNNLGVVTWTYSNGGVYLANSSGLFTSNKTATFINQQANGNFINTSKQTSVNTVVVTSKNITSGLTEDNGLQQTAIEIRVFI